MERRIAAVLIADVVGYGRLSQFDEEGTRARFQADFREIFEPRIADHQGRLVKTMGDGLLIEFLSSVNAIRCAVEVQRMKAERNAAVPPGRRLDFRIGINLGDVIVEGQDIHGDGVNIADRLQGLAQPGGVVISGTTYDQVKNRLEVGFAYLGEQRVKNIVEPVRVYRVLLDPKHAGKTISQTTRTLLRNKRLGAAGVLVIATLVGSALWNWPWQAPLSVPAMADKPSIAVLPFANLSGDPEQEFFADGITDDLITNLSQVSELFVIARNSVFTYKGRPVDVREVAKDLGVRYVLEGSIQRSADRVRINAQLIDGTSGGHIWAERFDGSLVDVFALQDSVTQSVADALSLRLVPPVQREIETTVPAAYDEFLRGLESYRRFRKEDFVNAIGHFEKAIALDPNYARAYAGLAITYARSLSRHWTKALGVSTLEAHTRARKYLAIANKHPTALSHQAAGSLALWGQDNAKAVAEFDMATALDPSDPWNFAYKAWALNLTARYPEALTAIDEAIRRDPHSPPLFLFERGRAAFGLKKFDQAAELLATAAKRAPEDQQVLLYLIAAYGHLGRKQDAASTAARLNQLNLRLDAEPVSVAWVFSVTGFHDLGRRAAEGFQKAGLPEYWVSWRSQQTLEDLLLGHTVRGRNTESGKDYSASFTPDGRVTLSGDWGSETQALVRFEGERFGQVCIEGRHPSSSCAMVHLNPTGTRAQRNEFIWVDSGGAFPFSQAN